MSAVDMVIVGGVRYRAEDAKRLGLVVDPAPFVKQAPAPRNKARKPSTSKDAD